MECVEISCEEATQKLFEKDFVSREDTEQVLTFVDSREEFLMQPVHMAANILDPRFQGRDLSDESISMAETVILQVASTIGIADSDCLDDLADFRICLQLRKPCPYVATCFLVRSKATELVEVICTK